MHYSIWNPHNPIGKFQLNRSRLGSVFSKYIISYCADNNDALFHLKSTQSLWKITVESIKRECVFWIYLLLCMQMIMVHYSIWNTPPAPPRRDFLTLQPLWKISTEPIKRECLLLSFLLVSTCYRQDLMSSFQGRGCFDWDSLPVWSLLARPDVIFFQGCVLFSWHGLFTCSLPATGKTWCYLFKGVCVLIGTAYLFDLYRQDLIPCFFSGGCLFFMAQPTRLVSSCYRQDLIPSFFRGCVFFSWHSLLTWSLPAAGKTWCHLFFKSIHNYWFISSFYPSCLLPHQFIPARYDDDGGGGNVKDSRWQQRQKTCMYGLTAEVWN